MASLIKGYMLLEIALVFSIIGIVFVFSIALSDHAQNNPLEIRKKELISILTYARLHAFLREQTLLLTPIHLSSNHEWLDGVQLYSATNTLQRKHLLHEWRWVDTRYIVNWLGFQSKDYIQVSADSSRLAMNGYFLLKNKQGKSVNKLIVNRFGRVK